MEPFIQKPPEEQRTLIREMFFETPPKFEEMLEGVEGLESEINKGF